MVSPVAANRSGVATRTAAARNPPASTSESIIRLPFALPGDFPNDPRAHPAALGSSRKQSDYDDRGLHHIHCNCRDSGVALHGSSTSFQRPNQHSTEHHTGRIEPSQQSNGNSGKAVPWRQVLKQGVRHSADLYPTSQPDESTGAEQCHRSDSLWIHSAADLRRAWSRAHRPEPESPESEVKEVPEHQTYKQGQEESGVKSAVTQ